MELPPLPRKGEPIRPEWGRQLRDYLRSLRIETGPGSGLASEVTPAGTSLRVVEDASFWIRITAVSGGVYTWNAVRATSGGTWVDLPAPTGEPGRDGAREENGSTTTVPQVVRAGREPYSHRLFFSRDTCG